MNQRPSPSDLFTKCDPQTTPREKLPDFGGQSPILDEERPHGKVFHLNVTLFCSDLFYFMQFWAEIGPDSQSQRVSFFTIVFLIIHNFQIALMAKLS